MTDSVIVHIDGDREVDPYDCPWCLATLNGITMDKQPRKNSVLVGVCIYCLRAFIFEDGKARKPAEGELPDYVLDAVAIMRRTALGERRKK